MNIAGILWQRASATGNHVAYTFRHGTSEDALTYEALHDKARRIAGRLKACIRSQGRVLLLYPPGPGYVSALFGCFYAGAIAIPAYPPATGRSGRNLKRLRCMISDARPDAVL